MAGELDLWIQPTILIFLSLWICWYQLALFNQSRAFALPGIQKMKKANIKQTRRR